jgi:hypothetical protein
MGSIGGQKPHRDGLDAVALRRDDLLLLVGHQLRAGDAEHDRHVRTVHVAVDHPDAASRPRQRNGQVHGDRRLADAALPRTHRDDVLHAGNGRARIHRFHAPHAGGHGHLHLRHASNARDGRVRLVAHPVLDGAGRRRQLDGERDRAAVQAQVLHEAERDDVAVEIGVLHGAQGVEHV